MKILILDASAIINGLPTHMTVERQVSTPEVIDEVKQKLSRESFALAVEFEKIEERKPKTEFVEKVEEKLKETNDNLSEQDTGLLALALEFKKENAVLFTDDYGIQNVAAKLGLAFVPVGERGINQVLHWQYYCPGCYKKYDESGECEVCGTKIKRKVTGKGKLL